MCVAPQTWCGLRITPVGKWHQQAMIERSRRVISVVAACCHSVKLFWLTARALRSQQYQFSSNVGNSQAKEIPKPFSSYQFAGLCIIRLWVSTYCASDMYLEPWAQFCWKMWGTTWCETYIVIRSMRKWSCKLAILFSEVFWKQHWWRFFSSLQTICKSMYLNLLLDKFIGVTDRRCRGANRPPWEAKCRNQAPLSLYLGFTILLVFSRSLFSCVFRSIFRWFRVLLWPSTSGFTNISQVFLSVSWWA